MLAALIILLIAALPVILILVFSELMAAKEGKVNRQDRILKIAKGVAWFLLALLVLLYVYGMFNHESGRLHLSGMIKIIMSFFEFIK
ncbi:MAG TPA: hypothetical protein PL131_05135 [Methylotenera sp.]|nr:hypothetical protein [Methylotenera sp.]HPH05238.1 hypothetical protein [Methylotenera sp.]HPN00140.1 hypothetical protein [Methylotenera sp.]